MTELLTRPLLRREEPAWGSRVPWLAAVLGSAWAQVAGFAVCALPGFIWWIADTAAAPIADPARFGAWAWLLSHGVGVTTPAGALSVSPLGLTIVLVLLIYRSARWTAHLAGVSDVRTAWSVIGPASLAYAIGAGTVALLTSSDDVGAHWLSGAVGAGIWAMIVTAVGVAVEADLAREQFDRIPVQPRVALRSGAAAVGVVIAGGAVLTSAAVIANAAQIGEIVDALDAGGSGSVLLLVGSALFVPNVVIWAGAFSLGPGFAVGVGTSVAPGGVEIGLVPAIPLLGALPSSASSVAWLTLIVPLAAGVLAGVMVHQRLPDAAMNRIVLTAGGSGFVAMVGLAMAAMLSAGSAGSGRLSLVGPVPGEVALATLLVVGVTAIATSAALTLLVKDAAE